MTNSKTNYIQTEIGLIPDDWKIGNMLDNSTLKARIGWQGLTTAEYLSSGDYFLVTGTDFFDGKIKWETCHFVEEERYIQDKNIQLKKDDILVTKDGTIGKVAIVDKIILPTTLNSGVFVVRPKRNSYNPQFLFYVLKSPLFDLFLSQLVAGSTIQHLYQKDFVYFKFPIPTLQEQTAIAQALSDTDNLITNLQNLINKKRQLKQAAMHQLLTPKEHWDKEKNSEFKNVKLGDIADIQRGASPRPIEDPIWFDNNSETGWVRISDVTEANKFLVKTTQRLSHLGIRNSRYVIQDSLIMSICATIGKPIITRINVCIHDGFVVFKNLKVNMVYLYYILEFIQNEWSKNGQTGSQMNLNTSLINNFQFVIIKSSQQQNYIAELLSDIDLEIESINNKLDKALKLKDGMMQNLLTGKIRLV